MRLLLPSFLALSMLASAAAPAAAAVNRRGKHKQKHPGGDNVLVVVGDDTANDTSDDPATVEVGFPTVEGGGSIDDMTITNGKRRKAHFKGMLMQWPATYSVTVELDDGTSVTAPVAGLDHTTAGSRTTVLLDGGYKVTLRMTNTANQVRAIVAHEDKFWDPTAITNVRVGDASDFSDLPHVVTTTRFVLNTNLQTQLPDSFGVGSGYTMTTTVKDAAGNVQDQSTQSLTMGDVDPIGPALERARVSVAPDGDIRVVSWTDGFDGSSSSVQAVLADDSGTELLSSLDDMPTATIRHFEYPTLTFDDPASAADEVYAVVIDTWDSAGSYLGSSDMEIVVEGLDLSPGGSTTDGHEFTIPIDGVETRGLASIVQTDASNFNVHVAIASGAVDGIDVAISAVSGPTADPENLSATAFDEWKRWATEGSAGSGTLDGGGSGTLTMVLLGEADAELGIDINTVSDLPDIAFKKRPGAPKGRLRSAKVRAIIDPIDWDASGTGSGTGTGSTTSTATTSPTSSDPAGGTTDGDVDANIGTSGGFSASASAGFGASASAGFGASASASP